jgi:hypothetical protein
VPAVTGAQNREESTMNFSEALRAIKEGCKVQRAGWNGKGMWVAWTPGSTIANGDARAGAAQLLANERPGNITINGHLDMKAADGTLVIGWLASQTDMLAEDWQVAP